MSGTKFEDELKRDAISQIESRGYCEVTPELAERREYLRIGGNRRKCP